MYSLSQHSEEAKPIVIKGPVVITPMPAKKGSPGSEFSGSEEDVYDSERVPLDHMQDENLALKDRIRWLSRVSNRKMSGSEISSESMMRKLMKEEREKAYRRSSSRTLGHSESRSSKKRDRRL